MAQRTPAQSKALEAKALKAESKSAGMRMLYEAGYSVSQVTKVFDVGYPFAYGVALRGGFAQTAAQRRGPGKGVASKVKSTKKVAAVATKVTRVAASAARERKAAPAARSASARQASPKAGRPSPARRAANRKTRVVAAPAPLSKGARTRIAAAR